VNVVDYEKESASRDCPPQNWICQSDFKYLDGWEGHSCLGLFLLIRAWYIISSSKTISKHVKIELYQAMTWLPCVYYNAKLSLAKSSDHTVYRQKSKFDLQFYKLLQIYLSSSKQSY